MIVFRVRIGRLDVEIVFFCLLQTLFALSAVAQQRQAVDPYCKGKHDGRVTDRSVTRRYDQGIGFNPSQYMKQQYVNNSWPVSEDLAEKRERFKTQSLKAFVKERGATAFDLPVVLDMIARNGASVAIRSSGSAFSTAVRIHEERGEVDCGTGTYSYSVEFLMSKNPLQVLSYPLRLALEDAVEKAVGPPFSDYALKDVLIFRIDEIIESIRKTLGSNERVLRECRKPETREALRLVHPRFRELFPSNTQANLRAYTFGVGEYRLSPEMAYVVEQILRRFLRRPEAAENQYELIVRGYADARPVREIPYDGTCEISGSQDAIVELTASKAASKQTTSVITSNSQLSIARGCEGALFASELIPPTHHVRVFYSGGGAIEGRPQDVHRRIELRFEKNL